MVDRASGRYTTLDVGSRPYWATDGPTGDECWVSVSGDDKAAVIDYATGRQVATVPVGDHPQRVRPGEIAEDILAS